MHRKAPGAPPERFAYVGAATSAPVGERGFEGRDVPGLRLLADGCVTAVEDQEGDCPQSAPQAEGVDDSGLSQHGVRQDAEDAADRPGGRAVPAEEAYAHVFLAPTMPEAGGPQIPR